MDGSGSVLVSAMFISGQPSKQRGPIDASSNATHESRSTTASPPIAATTTAAAATTTTASATQPVTATTDSAHFAAPDASITASEPARLVPSQP